MADYVAVFIQGFINGLANGTALWLLTRHLLKRVEQAESSLKREKEEEKKL